MSAKSMDGRRGLWHAILSVCLGLLVSCAVTPGVEDQLPEAGAIDLRTKIAVLTFNEGESVDVPAVKERVKDLVDGWQALNFTPDILAVAVQEAGGLTSGAKEFLGIVAEVVHGLNMRKLRRGGFTQFALGSNVLAIFGKEGFVANHAVRVKTPYVERCGLSKGFVELRLVVDGNVAVDFYGTHLPFDPSKPAERDECLVRMMNRSRSGHAFIAGDLNYRASEQTTPNAADKEKIAKYVCKPPVDPETCERGPFGSQGCPSHEQLSRTLARLSPEYGFYESTIAFCQTCRFVEGKSPRSYDPKRFPSWCDRILVKTPDRKKLRIFKYDADDISVASDHSAVFLLAETML